MPSGSGADTPLGGSRRHCAALRGAAAPGLDAWAQGTAGHGRLRCGSGAGAAGPRRLAAPEAVAHAERQLCWRTSGRLSAALRGSTKRRAPELADWGSGGAGHSRSRRGSGAEAADPRRLAALEAVVCAERRRCWRTFGRLSAALRGSAGRRGVWARQQGPRGAGHGRSRRGGIVGSLGSVRAAMVATPFICMRRLGSNWDQKSPLSTSWPALDLGNETFTP
jgi:hypothetical protein